MAVGTVVLGTTYMWGPCPAAQVSRSKQIACLAQQRLLRSGWCFAAGDLAATVLVFPYWLLVAKNS